MYSNTITLFLDYKQNMSNRSILIIPNTLCEQKFYYYNLIACNIAANNKMDTDKLILIGIDK